MGKLNQGPFQGFIGKTGGLVGRRWKGKYVVSAYQPVVANPKSSKQALQREFFAQAVALVTEFFSGTIRGALSTGWVGTTLIASNVGNAVNAIRYNYAGSSDLEVYKKMSAKTGSLSSGLSDNGNNIFDLLTIKQVGTTSVCNLGFDAEPGVKYFGSDIPMLNLHAVVMSDNNGIKFIDVPLQTDNSTVSPEVPKAYGFQESAEACGNWNFVYKILIQELENEAECNVVPTKVKGNVTRQAWFNIGFYVPEGAVINSRFIEKEITIV